MIKSWRLSAWCAAALLVGLVSCKKRPVEVSTTAYIIGPSNDILRFSESKEKKKHSNLLKSTTLIATKLSSGKVKFCSGVLIKKSHSDSGRILTNHHCFAVPGDDGKATTKLLPSACTETTVYFGFSANSNPKPFFTTCKKGSLKTDYQGDIATFELAELPPDDHLRLELMPNPPKKGSKALILHYPDIKEHMARPPESRIKLPEAAITTENCEVVGSFPKSEWILDRTLEHSLRHTCDLIHGSSGSGLIDQNTKKLIGINWGGIKVSYTNKTRTDNVATSASYVSDFLDGKPQNVASSSQARNPKSSNSIVRNEASPKENEEKEDPKIACGAVGHLNSSTISILWLLTPFILVLRKELKCF